MAKRKLTPKELRLVVATRRVKKDGRLRKNTVLHVARYTANGHVIHACNASLIDMLSVYYFPMLPFILECAPICNDCLQMLEDEGIFTPCSNTGVNSEVTVTNHVAK